MGVLNKVFFKIGYFSASNPVAAIGGALFFTIVFGMGCINLRLTNNPQELWVPPTSRANIEQTFFAEKFGDFFRINAMWLTPKHEKDADMDFFVHPYIDFLNVLENEIMNTKFEFHGKDYELDDFCFKPITGKGCIVTSVMQYWKDNTTAMEETAEPWKTAQCIPDEHTKGRACFDRIGTPAMPFAIFGKYSCNSTNTDDPCAPCKTRASGFLMNFLLNNNAYSYETAREWEKQAFIRNIKTFNHFFDYVVQDTSQYPGMEYNKDLLDKLSALDKHVKELYKIDSYVDMRIDYLATRSIPDDLIEETDRNELVILLSYIMMFVYVSVAIGFFPNRVHNRFLLGIAGITVVIAALVISIGINCYLGIPLTMISAEVVPFLILAIGVDNMFLISRAEREVPAHITKMELRVAFALKEIGPSIFTAAFCESLAFFIGMLTNVPALWSFCLVAGVAVITDFLLQITMFVAAMSLDGKRIQQNRYDCCFCLRQEERRPPRKEWLRTVFQKSFVPMVFHPISQILIIGISIMLLIIAICSCIKLKLGLNQNVGFVENSDPYRFFNVQYDYGNAGPPAYLTFKNIDYTVQKNFEIMLDLQIELSQLNNTVIAPIYSWVSPFTNFISTAGTWTEVCHSDKAAVLDFNGQMQMFVNVKIESECCQKFGICGEQFVTDISFNKNGEVDATRFRFQHRPVRYQEDYIRALVETRRVCDKYGADLVTKDFSEEPEVDVEFNIDPPTNSRSFAQQLMDRTGITSIQNMYYNLKDKIQGKKPADLGQQANKVFVYSLFYVFYDQYTYIRGVLAQNTMLGLAAVILSIQIIASLQISLLITVCVFLTMFNLMGTMWLLNEIIGGYPIEINAVFVVNLVTTLGFGVEFCNHIGMNFMKQQGTKRDRAMKALGEMGPSVVVGIVSTKFLGVIVLAFAPSTLFKLYYFRMYLFIIVCGAFNGLMLLPVLLTYIGPEPDQELIEESKRDLAQMAQVGDQQHLLTKNPELNQSEKKLNASNIG